MQYCEYWSGWLVSLASGVMHWWRYGDSGNARYALTVAVVSVSKEPIRAPYCKWSFGLCLYAPVVSQARGMTMSVMHGTTQRRDPSKIHQVDMLLRNFRFSLLQAQSYLLANLAFGDFLMGAYLIIIATADVYYRGSYAANDLQWRNSDMCAAAGFLSTFSGEISVLTLTVITIERFIVLAINSPLVKLAKHHLKTIMGFLYVIVSILCLVPFTENSYFKNFYGQSEMCLPLPIASKRQTHIEYTGELDNEFVTKPRPVISSQGSAWQYSVFIFVGINGLSFVAILIMYVWIFKSVRKTHAAARTVLGKRDVAMARKIFLIVGSDALCWFPVMGLAVYCLAGKTLPLRVSDNIISI